MADIGMMHYSLAKMGVRQLVRVAARELAVHGIRVNAVAPGPTVTPMMQDAAGMDGYFEHIASVTPLGRLGAVDDIADAVLALFALEWVTGQTLAVDGGITVCSSTDIPGIDATALASW
jgi:NAD(P)-dependent dehydrogenase (short-subunit alcohol dehydrogenase family)